MKPGGDPFGNRLLSRHARTLYSTGTKSSTLVYVMSLAMSYLRAARWTLRISTDNANTKAALVLESRLRDISRCG
jgi:hypothetical protein